jgi:hypothetical protein
MLPPRADVHRDVHVDADGGPRMLRSWLPSWSFGVLRRERQDEDPEGIERHPRPHLSEHMKENRARGKLVVAFD